MSMWSEIRALARAWHDELFAETGELPAADDLIERDYLMGERYLSDLGGLERATFSRL